MSVLRILERLQEKNIRLWVENDGLQFRAPQGAFDAALKAEVVAHKPEIIAFLQAQQSNCAVEPVLAVERSDTLVQTKAHLEQWVLSETSVFSTSAFQTSALQTSTFQTGIPETLLAESVAARQTFPLSYSQQRLWFLSQYEPDSSTYNCPVLISVNDIISVDALQKAMNLLMFRHESLRTTFAMQGKDPVQCVHPYMPVPVIHEDMSRNVNGQDFENRDFENRDFENQSRLQARATEFALAPFDLQQGPLLRALLISLSDTEHYLLLTLHHIITDGWSMTLLERELVALYQEVLGEETVQLPELSVHYADYALWQRAQIEKRVLPSQWPYWQQQLKHCPESLDLPTDFPRPAVQTHRGAFYRTTLNSALSLAVTQLARETSSTVFMLTLAAFKLLLMRYSEQTDICVGTPVANRITPETRDIIGFFVNTLVIRSDVQAALPFSRFLQTVKQTCLEAFDHQELPFEVLVDQLKPARDLSRSPLFQVMFALQNSGDLQQGGQKTVSQSDELSLALNFSKFDLNVSLTETEQGLVVECEYATDLFAEQTIARLFRHYENVLHHIIENPQVKLGEVSLFDRNEQADLTKFSAGSREHWSLEEPVHLLFERFAAEQPDALALRYESTDLSYAVLNQLASQLAQQLQKQGLQPGEICAICMERSVEMVVAILAVLKAGGAYLPLDPDLPAQRMVFMVQDSQTQWVLMHQNTGMLVSELPAQSVAVDEFLEETTSEQGSSGIDIFQSVNVSGEYPAYAIYTSGSTGKPKGVINQHCALLNRLLWMQKNHPIGPGTRVLQKTNYAFDVSVWEFLWPLIQGATLVLAKPGGHMDPSYLQTVIAEENIHVMHFVPSMLRLFLAAPELLKKETEKKSLSAGAKKLTSLEAVFCSGEALPVDLVMQFKQLGLASKLYNLYGPTEAAIDVTVWDCEHTQQSDQSVPIGCPISNLEIQILDPRLNPVPVGVAGEIYIGGTGLAMAYLRRADLTAERFIPNDSIGTCSQPVHHNPVERSGHLSIQPGARLYRTGDKGRFLKNGAIEYLGRLDFQVKIRGLRIEISEIEDRLSQMPQVSQAAVIVAKSAANEDYLVAYYSLESAVTEIRPAEFRQILAEFLPDYMVPSRFIPLIEFPLNASGKLDRKALAALPVEPVQHRVNVRPGSARESMISQVWAEVLELKQVDVEQNFFDLGGNSLLMVRAHQLLNEYLRQENTEVSLVKLFAHPTVRGLAQFIDNKQAQKEQRAGLSVGKVSENSKAIEKNKAGNQRLAQLRNRRKQVMPKNSKR